MVSFGGMTVHDALIYWYSMWLCFCVVISIYNLLNDIYVRFVTKIYLKDYASIHKVSSAVWNKIITNDSPTILDVIMDLTYILKTLSLKPVYFFISSIIFLFLFKYLRFITVIYITLYAFSLIFLCFKVLFSYIFARNVTICVPSREACGKVFTLTECFTQFLISPFRWSFITLYVAMSAKSGNFRSIGGAGIISSLMFKSPLWFIVFCITWANNLTLLIINPRYKDKSFIGILRTINADLKYNITMSAINLKNKTDQLCFSRKIIISGRSIKLNGGVTTVLNTLDNKLLFMHPVIMRFAGKDHQGFRKDINSNEFILMTSSDSLEDSFGGEYKCPKLNYMTENQYFTMSIIDTSTVTWRDGVMLKVMGNNGFFAFDMYCGLVIKMNVFYTHCRSGQVLVQSGGFKQLLTLKEPLPIRLSHTNTMLEVDIGEHDAYIQSITAPKRDPFDVDKAVNNVLEYKYSDIYNIAKKGGYFCGINDDMLSSFNKITRYNDL